MILDNLKQHRYIINLMKQCRKRGSRLKRWMITSAVTCFLLASWLAFTFSGLGILSDSSAGVPLYAYDSSAVPQSVFDDAAKLAKQQYGDSRQQHDIFMNQLLATYTQADDKDFVILFNPGGWGGTLATNSDDWLSIIGGIQSELDEYGYESIALNYQRTVNSLQGRLNEIMEMFTGYSSKAADLACRVKFLTSHNPDLRVILTGESTGSIIVDNTMRLLRGNKNVYSIETGAPFWHKSQRLDRQLKISNNGIVPDSFSEGKVGSILFATVKSWISPAQKGEATLLNFLVAPGHEYWWQNPVVYNQIANFLQKSFGVKAS